MKDGFDVASFFTSADGVSELDESPFQDPALQTHREPQDPVLPRLMDHPRYDSEDNPQHRGGQDLDQELFEHFTSS